MLRDVLRLWLPALGLSALLAAAGARWPEPLPIQGPVVVALLLVPPALMGLWLQRHWQPPKSDP